MNEPSAAANRAADAIVAEIRRRTVGRNTPILVALDGASGCGKSTLAQLIVTELGAALVNGDDFYAPNPWDAAWDARGAEARAADAIDWRRLRAEALTPLLAGRPAKWYAALQSVFIAREPSAVVVMEGVYCSRPELADLIDLTVLVDAPVALQHERLEARWGRALGDTPHHRWHMAEEFYFYQVRPPSSFDLVVTTDDEPNLIDG